MNPTTDYFAAAFFKNFCGLYISQKCLWPFDSVTIEGVVESHLEMARVVSTLDRPRPNPRDPLSEFDRVCEDSRGVSQRAFQRTLHSRASTPVYETLCVKPPTVRNFGHGARARLVQTQRGLRC